MDLKQYHDSRWSVSYYKYKYTNTQIYKYTNTQIHKYTNTQIQHIMKYQKDPICGIFLKRGLLKGIKNDTPMRQTRKCTNTAYHKVSEMYF